MPQKDPNTIDFSSLKEVIRQLDTLATDCIRATFSFLRKNLLVILLTSILGIGWGLYTMYQIKPVYTFEMTVFHGDLEKKTFSDIIDKLDIVAKRRMSSELSALLNLPEKTAAEIQSISTESIDGRPLKNVYSKDDHPFKIRVALSSPLIWQSVADAIKKFIVNQPYMTRLMKINHQRVQTEVAYLENEINQLNQLKASINSALEKGVIANDVTLLKSLDIPGIYQKSLDLYKEKERALNFLAFDEGVTIINHSASVNAPYHQSYSKLILGKWLLSVAAGLLLLFVVRRIN